MASINELEPEFVEFIQTQNYGTPKAFAKPHDYEDLKAYFGGHKKFSTWCVPCGCACPINIFCWTAFFPLALYSCLKGNDSDPDANAKSVQNIRYVLFPTMIVKLMKSSDGEVEAIASLNFLDYKHLDQEVAENVDDISRDGINGCVQNMMVPGLSGVLVIGEGTREIFTGGDRSWQSNYETRAVPELKILTPLDCAYAFSEILKKTLRDIKSGDYERLPREKVTSALKAQDSENLFY